MPYKPASVFQHRSKAITRQYENSPTRKADRRFYNAAQWRKFRAYVFSKRPLCEPCKQRGSIVPATQLDHDVDRKDAPDRAYDESNVTPMCHSCHSRKTAKTFGLGRR